MKVGFIKDAKRRYPQSIATSNGGGGGYNPYGPIPRDSHGQVAHDEQLSTFSRCFTTEHPTVSNNQETFESLHERCLQRGVLWEDPNFTPSYKLLPKSKKFSYPITWLRPHELTPHPIFYTESSYRVPLDCGILGDTWLILALSSLTTLPHILDRVIGSDQDFFRHYAGIFRFYFWEFGAWKEVCVDDRVPSCRGRPIGLQQVLLDGAHGDFWPCLLEKAYAKAYGGYDQLRYGSTARALQDITGGIVQSFSITSQERLLTYQVLNSAVPRSTHIVASIFNPDTPRDRRRPQKLRHGLISRAAYDITGLARVRDIGGNGTISEVPLVRLHGPWGMGSWTGSWSEGSFEWDSLPDRDKEVLAVRTRTDKEFWMSFLDFVKHFTHLDLVHLGPDDWLLEPNLQPRKPWRAVLAKRRWRKGYNAGGGPTHLKTTAMNPQFVVQIPRGATPKCHVVIAITQHYTFAQYSSGTRRENPDKSMLHAIGFTIYEGRNNAARVTTTFVSQNKPLDVTQHCACREVGTFFALPPGEYVILPQTKIPNCETRFLVRILSDENCSIWEVNDDNILYRNFSVEHFHTNIQSVEVSALLRRWKTKFPEEIDASQFQNLLKHSWKSWMWTKPSLETCRTLVMLRDSRISGRLTIDDLPPLLNILLHWKASFQKWDATGRRTSSYNFRNLLWESGLRVSNKVLECLVLRFAPEALLTPEAFLIAMLRLHLAHERYETLDTKIKTSPSPLSLEEMILMTIYS